MTTMPTVALTGDVSIPQLGFGTARIPPERTGLAVRHALEQGYRHVDTAQMYENEAGVGQGIREAGLPRDEVFVTSKAGNGSLGREDVRASFDRTLVDLGLEHLDLFLVHWPLPTVRDYAEAWFALVDIHRAGGARAVGVSNFEPAHLDRLAEVSDLVPAVNQIEVHPYLAHSPARAGNLLRGVVTEAWSPLGEGSVLDDPEVARTAAASSCTPAQAVLAWHLRRGDVVIPKTESPDRMAENLGALDVSLSDDAAAAIDALDADRRIGPHPDEFDWTPSRAD